MKSYYIDPLTEITADSPEELKKKLPPSPIEGLITFVVESDEDLSAECIKDPDTEEIYINFLGQKSSLITDEKIENSIPKPLKYFVSRSSIIDKTEKEIPTLSIIIKNYQLKPLLDLEELTMKLLK